MTLLSNESLLMLCIVNMLLHILNDAVTVNTVCFCVLATLAHGYLKINLLILTDGTYWMHLGK